MNARIVPSWSKYSVLDIVKGKLYIIDYDGVVVPYVEDYEEARRLALSTMYGATAKTIQIAGHEGRSYALGPEPEPDDPDGQMPAVVVWHDNDLFYLVASAQLDVNQLVRVANSMYDTEC